LSVLCFLRTRYWGTGVFLKLHVSTSIGEKRHLKGILIVIRCVFFILCEDLTMAERFAKQSSNRPQYDNFLKQLAELLEKDQCFDEISHIHDPELETEDNETIKRIQGSLVGLAVGDALGASVEFRPNAYLKQFPVKDMQSGGTWGLEAGQWTDDTSMTLCLAASLIIEGKSDPYDQFVRYKRWYRNGYMSSTGKCFDIGKATREAITAFESLQRNAKAELIKQNQFEKNKEDNELLKKYICKHKKINLGASDSAGNGSLMRITPIPSFFFQSYEDVQCNIDKATELTHGHENAIHACRFYAGLIWHAIRGTSKNVLLDPDFYRDTLKLTLNHDIEEIAQGSYKNRKGYADGIRGKGYVVNALEAALWAFDNDENSFEKGVLAAINLGDDTDTTAAIYGQLAGAVYGIDEIPKRWVQKLFQGKFIMTIAKGLYLRGYDYKDGQQDSDGNGSGDRNRDKTKGNEGRFSTRTKVDETSHEGQSTKGNNPSHHSSHTDAANQNRDPTKGNKAPFSTQTSVDGTLHEGQPKTGNNPSQHSPHTDAANQNRDPTKGDKAPYSTQTSVDGTLHGGQPAQGNNIASQVRRNSTNDGSKKQPNLLPEG
jgi:ADP-ribosyl-[dinitrogen reductase] hydrolase